MESSAVSVAVRLSATLSGAKACRYDRDGNHFRFRSLSDVVVESS